MKDLIQDHTLELLAAGALSPEESALILQRLEQQPEARAKLHELIEANEAFHQEYPAQYMLPHILRRAQSAQPTRTKRKKMKKLQAPLYGFAAIAAIALVIAGISQLNFKETERNAPEPDRAPTAQAPALDKGDSKQQQPSYQAAKAPAPAKTAVPKLWDDGELIFQLGEERYFDGSDVARVNIENEVLRPKDVNKETNEISFIALKVGLTTLELNHKDKQIIRYVRVAEKTPERVLDAAINSGKINVQSACLKGARLGSRQFRLVIDPKGRVMTAQVDDTSGLDATTHDCLIKSAKRWSFEMDKDHLLYTVALFNLEL